MTLSDWVHHHANIFGLVKEDHIGMVVDWAELLAREGFAADELAAATDYLALREPPKYPSEHFASLLRRLRIVKYPPERRPLEHNDPGTCTLCGNSGWVIVPAEGSRTAGGNRILDPLATSAVTCWCRAGKRIWDSFQRDPEKRPTSLTEYSDQYPEWRNRMREIEDIGRRKIQVSDRNRAMDAMLGKILARIQQRERKREPGEDEAA